MNHKTLSLMGMIFGVILGLTLPTYSVYQELFGVIFLKALKLMIIPLIAVSCFLAIAKIKSREVLKRLGLKTFSYYFLSSAIAGTIGITCAYLFFDIGTNANLSGSKTAEIFNFTTFVTGLIADNIFSSLSTGNIIQIVIFSLFFGFGCSFIAESKRKILIDFADAANDLVMVLIRGIIWVAPIGIFSLIYSTISKLDFSTLSSIKSFLMATLLAAFLHAFIALPIILKVLTKESPLTFFKQVSEALIIALSSASSSATLPATTRVLEDNAKVSQKTTSFVLPLGATLNMDGSSLYQAILLIFMAKLASIPLGFLGVVSIFVLVMFSSAGTAGIPSGGLVMMVSLMGILKIPADYIGLYILADRFLDYPITAINVWGDMIGSKIIDHHST